MSVRLVSFHKTDGGLDGATSDAGEDDADAQHFIDVAVGKDGINDRSNFVKSDALPCGEKDQKIVKEALGLLELPKTLATDGCPVVSRKEDVKTIATFMRERVVGNENFEFIQVHTPRSSRPSDAKELTKYRKYEGAFPSVCHS